MNINICAEKDHTFVTYNNSYTLICNQCGSNQGRLRGSQATEISQVAYGQLLKQIRSVTRRRTKLLPISNTNNKVLSNIQLDSYRLHDVRFEPAQVLNIPLEFESMTESKFVKWKVNLPGWNYAYTDKSVLTERLMKNLPPNHTAAYTHRIAYGRLILEPHALGQKTP